MAVAREHPENKAYEYIGIAMNMDSPNAAVAVALAGVYATLHLADQVERVANVIEGV